VRAGRAPVRHTGARPRPGAGRKTGHPLAPGRQRASHPVHHPVRHSQRQQRPVGIGLPDGGLVGITLAAAISAALVAWRLHQRRIAVPCWPALARVPAPPGIPAAIRALRRAHLRSLAADAAEAHGELWPDATGSPPWSVADDGDGLDEFGAPAASSALRATAEPAGDGQDCRPAGGMAHPHLPVSAPTPAVGSGGRAAGAPAELSGSRSAPPVTPQPPGTVVFGMRGSEEVPLRDVARPILGLTGPGAHAAARALVVGLLAASRGPVGQRARVIIPAADARLLTVGRRHAGHIPGVTAGWPDGLTVTASRASALDLIDAETARRRQRQGPGSGRHAHGERAGTGVAEPGQLVLIATRTRSPSRTSAAPSKLALARGSSGSCSASCPRVPAAMSVPTGRS
jgi:hypothetical protein